jgi:transcriptional regulator with XRE-family HTH domain
MSQRELAKRLGRARSFVGKIESGERQLNVLEFCVYADAADILRSVVKARGKVGGAEGARSANSCRSLRRMDIPEAAIRRLS